MVRPCVARGFVELAVSGLASMYPAFDWSVMLRATMDISARAISLADRPQRAIWVTSVRMRREDRSSISSHPLADLSGKRVLLLLYCQSAFKFERRLTLASADVRSCLAEQSIAGTCVAVGSRMSRQRLRLLDVI